jgi:hypothetical protein
VVSAEADHDARRADGSGVPKLGIDYADQYKYYLLGPRERSSPSDPPRESQSLVRVRGDQFLVRRSGTRRDMTGRAPGAAEDTAIGRDS